MNKLVLLLGAAAAVLYATKSNAKVVPVPATNPLSTATTSNPAGGPVFPAADPNASAAVPAGQVLYRSNDGVQFWHYLDANGFDHYVVGVLDAAFITNEASITMNRRTGAKVANDSDHRPSLDTPVAININLGSLPGAGRPASVLKTLG